MPRFRRAVDRKYISLPSDMFVALPHAILCDWTSRDVTVYWFPILRGVSRPGSSKPLRLFDVHMHILFIPDHATDILLVALKRGADPPVLFEMESASSTRSFRPELRNHGSNIVRGPTKGRLCIMMDSSVWARSMNFVLFGVRIGCPATPACSCKDQCQLHFFLPLSHHSSDA